MASSTGTILIIGGTGKVGSSLASLCQSSSTPYLVASRSSTPATSSSGHPAVRFDWLDDTTWSNPFTATAESKSPPITAVFLIPPPAFDPSPVMNRFVDLARGAHGVRRFVLLGATALEEGGTARHLQELGGRGEVGFGVMRPTWFMDNWAEHDFLRGAVRGEGRVYSAAAGGRLPWVSKWDIAACAFRALTAEEAPGGDCIILGPELLSYEDVSLVYLHT